MGVLNIPNTFTITRIILIPIFITAIVYKRYDYALSLFVIAGLTDIFDGLFARMKNQKTALGTFLDPLADKFLLVTSFVVFSIYEWIPKWLTITVISRDVIIVIGWFLIFLTTGKSKVDPSPLGKATILIQSLLIAYTLVSINGFLPDIPGIFLFLTAGITVLSGLHYVYRGLKVSHAD